MPQISCCCFDLETSNLSPDFGIILCGVIKPSDGPPETFRGDDYPGPWRRHRSVDSHVLRAIVSRLSDFDIWIAHNGVSFDVPFLRSRLLRWGMDHLPPRKLLDPCRLARAKLGLQRNSLAAIAAHLGCNTKTLLDPALWVHASHDGSRAAMDQIVEHCVQDVLTLERVATAVRHYSTVLNSYGSAF